MKQYRPRMSEAEYDKFLSWKNSNERRVLVIGDTHFPFVRDGYIDFLKETYDKYNCNEVVHIGDLIDNHYSSFHDQDPDGMSASDELNAIYGQVKKLADYFPKINVITGNHDLIPNRKAFSAGLSKTWIKPIKQVLLEKKLPVSNWSFFENHWADSVSYVHGTGRKARMRAKDDVINTVQGHYHSESYIEWFVGKNFKYFAMQVGCGMDDKAYAAAYGKDFKKMHINCGVVLENGNLPILEYMKL